ncbi:ferredoxin reductase domain-containing protein [Gelidibacter maritimus]|uniref:Flavodoxin reductase n=1 Tax=Gelidibacter maritimus TaxID=2761487 RepID=A0A7W2M6E4_9FLAO|nr:flavodoxin reductase [Gelidibacter maritimus]MBA6153556.1 flavodoxin reductase [Gelidibacter maritimus]
MKNQEVTIKSIGYATHDVLHIVVEKPDGMNFESGQATEIFINESGWENEGRPFTFVSLPEDQDLEFMIKTYPSRKGVTNKLRSLEAGDHLIINEVFGAIAYKGEGTFIAGGAGVTPFISIIRNLKAQNKLGDNKLIFANKTKDDIILKNEFRELLGNNFINILSQETVEGVEHGHITEKFLKNCGLAYDKHFYICGPPPMMEAVEKQLSNLNVKKGQIVKEEF